MLGMRHRLREKLCLPSVPCNVPQWKPVAHCRSRFFYIWHGHESGLTLGLT